VVRCADARLHAAVPQAQRLYGGFAFRAPVWRSGKRIYTKAADDLIGVFAILQTARALYRRVGRQRPPFIGLLTRAEEVGFVGAIAHLELGWMDARRRPLVAVSLEASRTLPGARIGKGPVVRLGDRRTVFSADGMQLLSELAARVLPQTHQRRIMDGGACEATAATAFGIPTLGLTVPLGNYHNQGLEGGADCPRPQGPAPEFVHLDDVQGLLTLCRALFDARLRWGDPWATTRRRLSRNRRQYARLLNQDGE
jgi:endoglucanase